MTKEGLEKIYKEVCKDIDNKTMSLLHLKSIGNFIDHFNELKEGHKENVSVKLIEYLNLLKTNRFLFTSEKIDSLFLFSEYINPIGVIYQKQLDFGLEIKLWMNVVTCVILLGICLILDVLIIDIVLLLFLFWYGRRQYNRRKKGKIYKYQY